VAASQIVNGANQNKNANMELATFSPAIREILAEERLAPLGPGTPNEPMRARLQRLTVESLCAPQPVADQDFARCCLAGLWLYHDFLDQAHEISQEIETASGSYWHGIMHRREPDYGNAAYWFRRVGKHPVFELLPAAARKLAPNVPIPSPWDPFWFIDYCEACANGKEPGEQFARLLQKREWELLFDYCYRQAVRA
jgi:hypothetical protein